MLEQIGPIIANLAIQQMAAEKLGRSNDFTYTKTATGTTLGLNQIHKNHLPAWRQRGKWNDTGSYDYGDVVQVLPTDNLTSSVAAFGVHGTASAGTWVFVGNSVPGALIDISVRAGGLPSASFGQYFRNNSVTYFPQWPQPTNALWMQLGGAAATASAGGVQRFKITDDFSVKRDFFSASMWVGPNVGDYAGTTTMIAKHRYFRPSILSENFFGSSVTYTWDDNNNRTTTFNSASQNEQLLPVYQTAGLLNEYIYCERLISPDTNVSYSISSSAGLRTAFAEWVDITPRVMARKHFQSS